MDMKPAVLSSNGRPLHRPDHAVRQLEHKSKQCKSTEWELTMQFLSALSATNVAVIMSWICTGDGISNNS